jgi:hypothetical protein
VFVVQSMSDAEWVGKRREEKYATERTVLNCRVEKEVEEERRREKKALHPHCELSRVSSVRTKASYRRNILVGLSATCDGVFASLQ